MSFSKITDTNYKLIEKLHVRLTAQDKTLLYLSPCSLHISEMILKSCFPINFYRLN